MNSLLQNVTNSTNDEAGPDEPDALTKAIISVIGAALIVTILLGNGLVIVLIKRFHDLRTPTNYFIMGMAIADFIVGLVMIISFTISLSPQIPLTDYPCLLYQSAAVFAGACVFFGIRYDIYVIDIRKL